MRLLSAPVLLFVLCCWLCLPVSAQVISLRTPAFRPFVEAHAGKSQQINRTPGTVNIFQIPGTGTSSETGATAGIEVLFPQMLSEKLSVALRLGADASEAVFRSDSFAAKAWDPAQNSITATNTFTVESSAVSTYVEGRLSYAVSSGVAVMVGPWATYRVSASATQRESILSPQDAVFPATSVRERVVATGEALLYYPLQYGVRIGSALSIPLASALSLRPEIALSVNIPAWREQTFSSALRPSLGFTLGFDRAETEILQPEPPPVPLALSVSLMAIDSTGNKHDTASIRVQTVLKRRYIGLPTLVQASTDSFSSAFEQLQANATAAYTTEHLYSADESTIYRDVWNIVGYRLRQDTAAVLTLALHPQAGRSKQTAQAIRSYLVDVWKINVARIVLSDSRDTILASGHILLKPSSPTLLAPIILQLQEEVPIAPALDIQRAIQPDSGWRQWVLAVQYSNRAISTIHSGNIAQENHTLAFPIAELIADTSHPTMTAKFTVLTVEGEQREATDTLPVAVERIPAVDTLHTYTLFLPATMKDSAATTINDLLLEHLLAFTDSSTAIVVTAYGNEALRYASESGSSLASKKTAGVFQPAQFSINREHSINTPVPPFIRITARKADRQH